MEGQAPLSRAPLPSQALNRDSAGAPNGHDVSPSEPTKVSLLVPHA